MALELKPCYLIEGDDHGRVAERRARLRALAEGQPGAAGVELFEGERATVQAVAVALRSTTLAIGRRVIIVDGVERWTEAEVAELEPLLAALPADTTVAFFAREEQRAKAPDRLRDAVGAAGGAVSVERALSARELPRWVIERGSELGLELDSGAAQMLVARVGHRQQRLLRELERLALEMGAKTKLDAESIEELTVGGAERRVWTLADALVARDAPAATKLLLELRSQGERLPGLTHWMVQRTRLALEITDRLEKGEAASQVRRSLRMPQRAAERLIADARRAERDGLRHALERLADLELETRGGGVLSEDTSAVRAIAAITA
ncbi:MAG: DNA polymerase III subunit delta [Solirubrobacteraceae bacterium]|nr:MAG: DNA polymerase III subunit delta [Solirubrobacterales bacterium]